MTLNQSPDSNHEGLAVDNAPKPFDPHDRARIQELTAKYELAEVQRRENNIRELKASYLKRLEGSPRYQELLGKFSKPTVFIEGTNRIKERAPDPSFGRLLSPEGVEAPQFPGAKIITFEKDGGYIKYALKRDQYGELSASKFLLQEKSGGDHWVSSQSPTRNASAQYSPDSFRIAWTQQVHGRELEEMEAFIRANDITVE
jgi:hypothetical protein